MTTRCEEVPDLRCLWPLADELIERPSLGQCRLIEVRHGPMIRPKVLSLDEPSSVLHRPETAAVAEMLREAQREDGFWMLPVEHDVELVSSFNTRCYVLNFGRRFVSGATPDLLASRQARAAYLGDVERPAPPTEAAS